MVKYILTIKKVKITKKYKIFYKIKKNENYTLNN